MAPQVYATDMEKKPPADNSQNRFAEVIRRSQQVRQELHNKARKRQIEEAESPIRDTEMPEPDEEITGA